MKLKNSCGGFTLVELLVVILAGSVVTLAAVTILLLGLRVNNQSGGMATRQNTTRILLTAMEDVIAEATVTGITTEPAAWQVKGEDDKVLFSYNSADRTICTGGRVILEDVIASHITWDDTGKLITISVETEYGSYTSSTYCRKGIPVTGDAVVDDLVDVEDYVPPQDITEEEKRIGAARTKFLKILASQYKLKGGGVNPGLILENGYSTGEYYAQWYESTWPADTAWCVCYVSWALNKTGEMSAPSDAGWPKWFANTEYFKDYINHVVIKNEDTTYPRWKERGTTPDPGDLIFFDWNGNGETQHIGVVLTVSDGYVYTIEGNSANIVAVRKYALRDQCIDGYVSFAWLLNNHPPQKENNNGNI